MNSSTSEVLWPSPVAAHESTLAISLTNSQHILCARVAGDILAAIANEEYTATSDMTTELSADVQYVCALLNQGGYAVAHDAENLVISW